MPPAGKTPTGPSGRYKHTASKEPDEEGCGPWLNLWLGNLSPETVDEDLMEIFGKCGAMDAVTSYLPRPYAFVYFRNIDDAKAAKEVLQGIVIRGKSIRVEFARQAKPGKTLWIGGISQSVKKEQLEGVFLKFGKIEEFKFLRHRGSAFICFQRIEDAIAAQRSMNWKHLGGCEIRVDFQRSPFLKRDYTGDRDYGGSKNLLVTDQLVSPDEIRYFHDSPNPGLKIHPVAFETPYRERRDGQLSNVLWVGYPPELQIDEELLHNSLILFGEIERIQSFPSRHYCYVEFRSVDEARRAKEGLQGRLLGDSRIQILFSNSEPVPGWENFSLAGQEIFLNEHPIAPPEVFFPGHPMAPNHFPGHLAQNVMPSANILGRPFTTGFDPHHGGSDFNDFGAPIRSFPNGVLSNPRPANWKRLSPSASGILTSGPRMRPPFRPSQGGWDEFDIREPKRTRLDGFPSSDTHFQGEVAGVASFLDAPRPDKIFPGNHLQSPDIQVNEHSGASPAVDYCWRGIIAKGGTPVCHARCLPIETGIEAPFPEIVNCSARTGLDMLTTHYTDAVGFDMVYFLPDSEDDFASYTEFLRYLGQRDRAGVAKFDDGTTMFLVPPSDFLRRVLKFSGPERLYGVVLKLPQQTTVAGHQPEATTAPPRDSIDTQQAHASTQRSYGFMPQNENQPLKLNHGSSSYETSIPNAGAEKLRVVNAEQQNAVPFIPQDHRKSDETTSQLDVSLTPELIATLASLIPTNTRQSVALLSQMPSSSSGVPSSYSAPPHDNSMLLQGWGQGAKTIFSVPPVEQQHHRMQNLLPPGHQNTSLTQLIPHYSTYTNITNTLDNSFQPAMVGMPMQEASLHMEHVPGIVRTVGNTVSLHAGQLQVLPNIQSNDAASIYNMSMHQQITPAPVISHNANILQILADTPVMTDRLNANFPSQARPLLEAISSYGQAIPEGDVDKDQRYHSTLQFAASLLLQIQHQQHAKAHAGPGSGNQQ